MQPRADDEAARVPLLAAGPDGGRDDAFARLLLQRRAQLPLADRMFHVRAIGAEVRVTLMRVGRIGLVLDRAPILFGARADFANESNDAIYV